MTERTFYVPRVVGPLQVELPEFEKKGRKGALHIRPSSTLFLSDDEVKFLSEKEPILFSKLRETTPQPSKKRGTVKTSAKSFLNPLGVSSGSSGGESESASSAGRKKKDKE